MNGLLPLSGQVLNQLDPDRFRSDRFCGLSALEVVRLLIDESGINPTQSQQFAV